MEEMKLIYNNDAGTSFFWITEEEVLTNKVQLIFRETGFYFSLQELKLFQNCINESYQIIVVMIANLEIIVISFCLKHLALK